jgi:hypothetical protein
MVAIRITPLFNLVMIINLAQLLRPPLMAAINTKFNFYNLIVSQLSKH